jgi:2-C-methyl-D-erythritol 4-phosphate cytidylyltransferase
MDYVIIVAGGKGLRMGGEVPKQFLPVAGRPVLMRTMERFREYSDTYRPASDPLRIILVLPKAQQDYWQQLCREHRFNLEYLLADGGATRFHSVQSGLSLIPDDASGVVGVHDGVRPFVSIDTIARLYDAARRERAVVPCLPMTDSLRRRGEDGRWHSAVREDYRTVQTPQVFDIQLLKEANRQPYDESFTDDASVVAAIGHEPVMIEGNRENIKITTPMDMMIAEAISPLQLPQGGET